MRSRSLLSCLVAVVLLAVLAGEAGPVAWALATAGKSGASAGCPCKVKMPCCREGKCMLGRRGPSRGPAWDACPEHGPTGALPLSPPPAVLAALAAVGPPAMAARTFTLRAFHSFEIDPALLVPPPRVFPLSSLAV